MAFNVENFTSVIASKGLASSNKFEVAINFPSGLRSDSLELMCDTVTIAGKNIQTTPEIHYGIRREVAYGTPTFDGLALTFYCTEELEEKRLLDKWQNLIVQHSNLDNTSAGGNFDIDPSLNEYQSEEHIHFPYQHHVCGSLDSFFL